MSNICKDEDCQKNENADALRARLQDKHDCKSLESCL